MRSTGYSGKLDYGWITVTGWASKDATLPYDGTGIGVAIVDSGMNGNREFSDASGKSRIVYQKSFVAADPNWAGDAFGHGGHVRESWLEKDLSPAGRSSRTKYEESLLT